MIRANGIWCAALLVAVACNLSGGPYLPIVDGALSSGGSPGNGGTLSSGGSSATNETAGGSSAGGDAGDEPSGSGGALPAPWQFLGKSGYDCSAAEGEIPALQATLVAEGLEEPMLVTHEPDGAADRLFVVERPGRIRIVEGGTLLEEPFLDITGKVVRSDSDERGLLGLAFHPNYEENGLFYVHYSDEHDPNDTGDSIIEEYQVSLEPNRADADSARLVLRVEQPLHDDPSFRNHKGGSIDFGSDGNLYVGLGDGGGVGDPFATGQDVTTLLGKILRIDPTGDGAGQYTLPLDNLKQISPDAAPEIWDYGLRNPFRFSFDGCTGDFYIGDVGQDSWEEVDIEPLGGGRKNYGWKTTEGTHCYDPADGCDPAGITPPAFEYNHGEGKSITGGAVYRGRSLPGLRGRYVYADYQENKVWSFVYDEATGTVLEPLSHTQDLNNVTRIVSIANGADGEIYFTSLEGRIYRLAPFE